MCIICVELDKKKLSPWEARANLTEMVDEIGPVHAREVENKISDAIFKEVNLNYGETVHDTVDTCNFCHCEVCACSWYE